jgi:hypothetical protein
MTTRTRSLDRLTALVSSLARLKLETFQAVVPETSVLIGFAGIIALSVLCVYVWANQVVPVSRANLAVSKRRGPVKEYLDELRIAGAANATDDTLLLPLLLPLQGSRAAERWLFTDWLEKPEAKVGRQKEPALPVLKNAKWNSGDNPVLVASALIGAGVILTSITERIAETFQRMQICIYRQCGYNLPRKLFPGS